jgi:hypothetical protein
MKRKTQYVVALISACLLIYIHLNSHIYAQHSKDLEGNTLKYYVIDEKVTNIATKLKLIVSGKIDENGLRALMNDLYKKKNVNVISIFAYTSKERVASHQWIAMLFKARSDKNPIININNKEINAVGLKPERRFGLSEDTRKKIYLEISGVEVRALTEADRKYPPTDTSNIKKNAELYNQLVDKYKARLLKKYGMTKKQYHDISYEGFSKEWLMSPLPPGWH